MTAVRMSVLDLAPVDEGGTVASSFAGSVALAQAAEREGFERVWYAEHHNMRTIASSATAVLIAHIASQTSTIRLGSGGIMLPNHSPLVIAEQFGTLETLHPGRIDLGLGRAPGTDQRTIAALRRDVRAAETFPQDVLELQGYLAGASIVDGIAATPGAGTNVPLTILGSSMFGAQLAAHLGLPYAFASHFAPDLLQPAIAAYRAEFKPSAQRSEPYVIAGFNVVAAPSREEAQALHQDVVRQRVFSFLLRDRLPAGTKLSDEELDAVVASPQGSQIAAMMRKTAIGTGADAAQGVADFAEEADADEVIVAFHGGDAATRVRGLELLAAA